MKTKLTILKFIIVLCSTFAVTAVFGQTNFIWVGPVGGDVATTNNWNVNGVVVPSFPMAVDNDVMEFNGQTTGPVAATSNTGAQTGASGSTEGINIHLTSSQTAPVTLYTTDTPYSTGIRMNGVTMDAGCGSLNWGDAIHTNSVLDFVMGGAGGQQHDWVNDSANPMVIFPNWRCRFGGGGTHTFIFDGTGNFDVTNTLKSSNGSTTLIDVLTSGTVYWTYGYNPGAQTLATLGTPVQIFAGAGTLVLESGGSQALLTSQAIENSGTLEYNAPATSTLTGIISDNTSGASGTLQVNNGTLKLQAANTYTGTNILSGGELIAETAESPGTSGPIGEGGANSILFVGGTLGWSIANNYDYSPRFSTNPNQAFSLDVPVNVTLATGLASSGGTLTKLGAATLTLAGANTYNGTTTVSAGTLVLQGTSSSTNFNLASLTTLDVYENGTPVSPLTFTVGNNATLAFDNVTNTTAAPLQAGTLSASGITINVLSGTFNTVGQSYPLLHWTSGAAPTVTLGVVVGGGGNLSISGNTVYLTITSLAYTWTGLGNGDWDTTSANNWKFNGSAATFVNGNSALFDDTATGTTNVTLNAAVTPAGVTVSDKSLIYSIASSSGNDIAGSGGLTKIGGNPLNLSGGANTYTGVTAIDNGVVSVGVLTNSGDPSDIGAAANSAANIVLNGGTLQYTGNGARIDHLFTVGPVGGTLDSSGNGALLLTNTGALGLSGTGAHSLVLQGSDANGDTLAASLADNGGPTALTKLGTGTWTLTGNNVNSGAVTIFSGELLLTGNGTLGTGSVVNNGSIDVNETGTVTINAISGSGSVTNDGSGTLILAGNNSYTGGTMINAGTLQVGNGGPTGALDGGSPVVDNGLLIFNSTGTWSLPGFNGVISGTGNLIVEGNGADLQAIELNTYTGWTLIGPGATYQPIYGNQGQLVSSVVTNNGTLYVQRQDWFTSGYSNDIVGIGEFVKDVGNANPGDFTLAGTNTYTGGTFIEGGEIILGDGVHVGAGTIVGSVCFTNTPGANELIRALEFNHPENFTFTNLIYTASTLTTANQGQVWQQGTNVVILTANNTYNGGPFGIGTVVSNGVLQVGNGSTTGAIGTNGINIAAGELAYDRSDNITFFGNITGAGTFAQIGSGTFTLTGGNTLTGSTTVSNGTLVLTAGEVGGNLIVSGGTLVPAAVGSVGTLVVTNNMTIASGTVSVALNKSLAPSNSMFSVSGTITVTGGTLQLSNVGPTLAAGDRFVIFNQAVPNGSALTISSSGATFNNNLATDGSVSVATVAPSAPTITKTFTPSTGQLILSWPSANLGMHLYSQTNSLTTGLGTNWVIIQGSQAFDSYTNIVSKANGTVFYRLGP